MSNFQKYWTSETIDCKYESFLFEKSELNRNKILEFKWKLKPTHLTSSPLNAIVKSVQDFSCVKSN